MLAALLRGTDWSKIADYLSPVLFQVVPPLAMAKQVQALVTSYRDKDRFSGLVAELAPQILRLPLGIQLAAEVEDGPLQSAPPLGLGERVLRLYFWQILTQPVALLDLRSKGWAELPQTVYRWQPAPLLMAWEPDFITAVRQLYRGFYHEDEATLDQGLEAIGLKPGKAALIAHFGQDQTQVAFDLAHFRSSFHDIFVACKNAKSRLHPNVLGLGAALACLYEHLQTLGGSFDARAAYVAAEDWERSGDLGRSYSSQEKDPKVK